MGHGLCAPLSQTYYIMKGGDKFMNDVNICDVCLKTYEPEEIDGMRRLKVFNGYTIDLRLKQFRKANIGEELEFIEFDSKEGQELLQKMHVAVLN